MSESIWEQVVYGDRCMHGTPIGTPGGADLMCGYCEDGYTTWVPERTFELVYYANVDWPTKFASLGTDVWENNVFSRVLDAIESHAPGATASDWATLMDMGWRWGVQVEREGYWSDE